MADAAGAPLTVVQGFLELLNLENTAAGGMISAAGAVDSAAMTGAVMAAMGAIGVPYVSGYAPAQASNLACTNLVGAVHVAIGATTEASKVGYLATDAVNL